MFALFSMLPPTQQQKQYHHQQIWLEKIVFNANNGCAPLHHQQTINMT
jgi:hypothetical protein